MNEQSFCRGENIVLTHGSRVVTPQPLNFTFPSGKATALIGPNGSGKTTLLRAITGETTLSSGTIFLGKENRSVREIDFPELSRLVAVVPQEHHYPSHLLLTETLCMAFLPKAGLWGRLPNPNDPRIIEALDHFALQSLANRPLGQLSTGERQRAFLARAFLQQPRMLLLDEPTNHLDPGGRETFWRVLTEKRKKTAIDVVISTHDLAFVKTHCEWVCGLSRGEMVYLGPTKEFFEGEKLQTLFGGRITVGG